MKPLNDERGRALLLKAVDHLRELTVDVRVREHGPSMTTSSDAVVVLTTDAGAIPLSVHVVWSLSPDVYTWPEAHEVSPGGRVLLVAPHVTPGAARKLRSAGLNYVDSGGNAFIVVPGLRVDVRGRKPSVTTGKAGVGRPSRAFNRSGLKVVFTLLCRPDLAQVPLRTLAESSGVSLGTAQGAVADLREQRYLGGRSSLKLQQVGDLFERWTHAFLAETWPKLGIQTFDVDNPDWWRGLDDVFAGSHALLGGESAAEILGAPLRPVTAVVYGSEKPTKLVQAGRLRASESGSVMLRKRFWRFEHSGNPRLAPSLLVYADLRASGDPRQLKAAHYLRQNDENLRRLDRP